MASRPLYTPLGHGRDIRLLRIKSGRVRKSIEVSIEIFSLDSDVHFTALSYVWGNPVPQSWIVCNGHRILITRNLWEILSTLKEQRHDSLLWADAICINQRDNEEKRIQVSIMRDIYKRAESVVFWLGQEERHDKAAVRLMNVFVKNHQYDSDLESLGSATLQELRLPYYDFGWIGWASLLSRPWFGRVWVVQEFLNATQSVFMSGALKIPTNLLIRCAYATGACAAIAGVLTQSSDEIRKNRVLVWRPMAFAIDQRSRMISGVEDVRIVDLWTRSQLLEATDPRDRVFALLSTQTAASMDIVDYKKDVEAVYEEIARIALTISVAQTNWYTTPSCNLRPNPWGEGPQRTSRFLACKTRTTNSSSLPSWVPDWRPADFRFVPLTRYFPGSAYFNHEYHHAIINGKTLRISGMIVDRPRIIIDAMPYMEFNQGYAALGNADRNGESELSFEKMRNWQVICYLVAESFRSPSKKREFIEAFCRTMAFNALPKRDATPAAEYIASFQSIHNIIATEAKGNTKYSLRFQIYDASPSQRIVYESTFVQLSAGRKFCITKKGSLAWVPKDTTLGDYICFLAGCAVPFVIRRIGKSFELLGDCYLHGMMSEASVTFNCRPQTFELL